MLKINRKNLIKYSVSTLTVIALVTAGFFLWNKPTETKATWWNDLWGYRKAININGTKVTGNLTNFPILVNFTDTDLSSYAQADGDDIVFTDAKGEKIPHEIEKYVTETGELIAWVKMPELAASVDTYLYMYYGNSGAEAQEDPKNVWDNNFVLVHHHGDTQDSTQYANHGVNTDAVAYPAGKINGAYDFVDTTAKIAIATSASLENISNLTVSSWVYVDSAGGGSYGRIIDHDYRNTGWIFYVDATKYIFADFGWVTQEGYWTVPMSTGGWYHVTVTYNNSSTSNRPDFYVDGVLTEETLVWTPTGSHAASSSNTIIGNNNSGTRNFDGRIDESRISNTIRSASWIATEYNNQSSTSTFYSLQPQEVGPGPRAYWRFDEGYGSTAHDQTAHKKDGTITGAAWQTEDMCVSGKCLYFDGSGDKVEAGDIDF